MLCLIAEKDVVYLGWMKLRQFMGLSMSKIECTLDKASECFHFSHSTPLINLK